MNKKTHSTPQKKINQLQFEEDIQNILGIKPIKEELLNTNNKNKRNHIDVKLSKQSIIDKYLRPNRKGNNFGNKIADILEKNSVNWREGSIAKGGFSWVIDIGEGQILHICTNDNEKIHGRYKNVPEILQPITTLYRDNELQIELLPKVKTEGVTKEHIYSLVSSLAKKGLLFADCKPENVGLINVDGKDIPLVIGDGAVIDTKNLDLFSDTAINERLFYSNVIFYNLLREVNDKKTLKHFQTNQDYTHYPWVNPETGKSAQDEYIEQQGLKKDEIKGIIPKDAITELQQRDLSPIAKELVDLMAEHCLREQDVKKLATITIDKKWGDKFKNKQEFIEFAQQNKSPITR